METKLENLTPSNYANILAPLFEVTTLSKSDCEEVCIRITKLERELKISHSWQLELLTGRIIFFKQYLPEFKKYLSKQGEDFDQDEDCDLVFYAICSESENALNWLNENNLFLLEKNKNTIKQFSILTATLKSSSLINWILNTKKLSRGEVKIFLAIIGIFWVEGLNIIKQIDLGVINLNPDVIKLNPDVINKHGSILFHAAILNKKSTLFEWVVLNMPDKLMSVDYFEEAVRYGMLNAVSWFLKCAPAEILNYENRYKTTILHLSGLSKSNQVFSVITECKKDSLKNPNIVGRYLTEYALNSLNSNRLNYALHLCNLTHLNLVHVPKGFKDLEINGDHISGEGIIQDVLADTVNRALDSNFTLQEVTCGIHKLPEEANAKIQRNVTIAAFEKAKPTIIFLLFIRSEINFPLEIVLEIGLKILPKEVPLDTVTIYRQHFFSEKNKSENTKCLTFEENDNSQKEINCINEEIFILDDINELSSKFTII